MWSSRREFVKLATASGIALSLSRLAYAEESGFTARAATGSGDGRRRNIYRRAFYCGVYGWRGRGASRNLGYCAGYGDFGFLGFGLIPRKR